MKRLRKLCRYAGKPKLFHYVYLIQCDGSKKFYIGKHSCNSLDCDYLGSGVWVSSCISGGRTLRKSIIWESSDEENCLDCEQKIISQMKKRYPNYCMNVVEEKQNGTVSRFVSDETKEKLRIASTGRVYSEETKRKKSESMKRLFLDDSYREKNKSGAVQALKRKNSKKVVCLLSGHVFDSAGECAKVFGVSRPMVTMICCGKRKSNKYNFEYI